MKKILLAITILSISCSKKDETCMECGNPTPGFYSKNGYCEGYEYSDDHNVAPNYDGTILTQANMQTIIDNSNGWCQWITIAGETDIKGINYFAILLTNYP